MARPRKRVVPPSRSVTARLIGLGGQKADGSPDVGKIAERLGRSPATVRGYLKSDRLPGKTEAAVSSLEAADARRPRWIPVSDEGPTARALVGDRAPSIPAVTDVRGSLAMTYGRPDGTIDTRRAATELGVSQRTVQRWAKGVSRPMIQHQAALRSSVRQTALQGRRGARMGHQGAEIELEARIQISGDTRRRRIGHQTKIRLSGVDMQRITTAYAAGGDAAADRELARAVAASQYGKLTGMDALSISEIGNVRFRR